ncbi:hypothetical protein BGW37DRAFT_523265 [Umbelopsis sp. PMI_123]|nr:hypothetical protein BGW37DRAFT_523265 [Umbelopsis sp. PMI_123]
MKFISVALLAFAASVASAADAGVLFNSPLDGTVWTAGSVGTITCLSSRTPSNQFIQFRTSENTGVTTLPSIDLKQGPATALQLVMNIATNVAVTASPFSWNIPATVPAGSNYAITIGISPNISYSGVLTIQAATGAATSGGANSSVAVSSAPASSSPAAATSTSAAATSAMASSGSATSAMASSAASSAPAATKSNGSSALKAGVAGVGLVAGAAALLL